LKDFQHLAEVKKVPLRARYGTRKDLLEGKGLVERRKE